MIANNIRESIVAARQRGLMVKDICKAYGIKANAVFKLSRLYRETGSVSPRTSARGRKPALSREQIGLIRDLILAENDITLDEIKERLHLEVTIVTICRIVKKLGFSYKKRVYTQANATDRT
ncbi:MAG: hypothetical protein LBP79_06545 [Clostridiales bacterium]|jgi:transposase|nr:hypothetical protein [Clostridiales bacterium]